MEAKNKIVIRDLGSLTPEQQEQWALEVCQKYAMDIALCPISFIKLNGKVTPYLNRTGSEQLIFAHKLSVKITDPIIIGGICTVRATASLPNGTSNDNIGCVSVEGLTGDALCNAVMKAVTKAKRRAVIGAVGLGFLDETEVDSIRTTVTSQEKENKVADVTMNAMPVNNNTRKDFTEDDFKKLDDYCKNINSIKDILNLQNKILKTRNISIEMDLKLSTFFNDKIKNI